MKWEVKWIKIIIVAVIIGIVICFLPWRYHINTILNGVESRIGDENYSENVSVTVKGVYKQYLFRDDVFEGEISVDKYEFTKEMSEVTLNFNDGNSPLVYSSVNDGYVSINGFGTILCTPNFNNLLILISEPVGLDEAKGWSGENGLFISAPSTNREQAIDKAKELSKKSNWLSNSTMDWK